MSTDNEIPSNCCCGFLNVFPNALLHVCRNLYFGAPGKSEWYNGLKSRKIIARKGRTLDFSDMKDRMADKLYSGRRPTQKNLTELPIEDRTELRRWKNACSEMFRTALTEV